MIQQFSPIFPASELLKKYIYCFYFYESNDEQNHHIHYSLPHVYNAVSIYSGATIELHPKALFAHGNGLKTAVCVIQGKQQAPVKAEMTGCFQRITILFKPLGLNQFISRPIDQVMGKSSRCFTEWNAMNFENVIDDIFSGNNATTRLYILEKFLGDIFCSKEFSQLKSALALMDDFNNVCSIAEIAKSVNLSLRTFNRLFHSQLGVAPVTHRRILRFRQSLESKVFGDKLQSLTTLSYQTGFYDQSEFIRLYKQMSGATPKALLASLQRMGDSNLLFKYPDPEMAEKYN